MENFVELEERETDYSLVENLGFGFFRIDRNGVLKFANKSFINILEFKSLSDISKSLLNDEALQKCFVPKRFLTLTNSAEKVNEFFWVTQSKAKKLLREFVNPVYKENELLYFDCFVQDITEKNFLEKIINDLNHKDSSILKAIPDYIFVVSKNFEVIESKNNFQKLFSNYISLTGLSLKVLFSSEIMEQLEPLIIKTFDTGEEQNLQFFFARNNNHIFFEARIVMRNHEEVVIILRDISLQKEAEEKLKKVADELRHSNVTKDKFLSIIAHDLRTPINGLLNYAEILCTEYETLPKEEIKEFSEYILEIARSTNNLLNNLLEWARIQSGRISFEPEDNNIFLVIEKIIQMLSILANNKRISIVNGTNKNLVAFFDKNMISSILLNLVNNAIKFTNQGGNIEVLSKEFDNYYEFSVKDNGIGITEDNIKRILANESTFSTYGTSKEKGTGLGLVLCKEFIKIHKGTLRIESKIGFGTTFSFTINK